MYNIMFFTKHLQVFNILCCLAIFWYRNISYFRWSHFVMIIIIDIELAHFVASTLTSLTRWGRVTHICVSRLTIIGSYTVCRMVGAMPFSQTNATILLIRTLWAYSSEILSEINAFLFTFNKMHMKTSCAKWRSFCLGLNVLTRKQWRRWSKPVLDQATLCCILAPNHHPNQSWHIKRFCG